MNPLQTLIKQIDDLPGKIKVSGQNSKELLSKLIRNEFDKDYEIWDDTPKRLIQLAKDYGLNELATEMQNDL